MLWSITHLQIVVKKFFSTENRLQRCRKLWVMVGVKVDKILLLLFGQRALNVRDDTGCRYNSCPLDGL